MSRRCSWAWFAVLSGGCATHQPTSTLPPTVPARVARPFPDLLEQLQSPEAHKRAEAAWALADVGTVSADTIQRLLTALDDQEESVREGAAWALAHVKSPGFEPSTLAETLPRIMTRSHPKYPKAASSRKIQGTVVVEVLIGSAGRITHTKVIKSIPGLDEAALACVGQWTFEPARRSGRPVPMTARTPVMFKIY